MVGMTGLLHKISHPPVGLPRPALVVKAGVQAAEQKHPRSLLSWAQNWDGESQVRSNSRSGETDSIF